MIRYYNDLPDKKTFREAVISIKTKKQAVKKLLEDNLIKAINESIQLCDDVLHNKISVEAFQDKSKKLSQYVIECLEDTK